MILYQEDDWWGLRLHTPTGASPHTPGFVLNKYNIYIKIIYDLLLSIITFLIVKIILYCENAIFTIVRKNDR